MAETYKKLPSEIVGIDDPLVAYCFDRGVLYAGLNRPEALKSLL